MKTLPPPPCRSSLQKWEIYFGPSHNPEKNFYTLRISILGWLCVYVCVRVCTRWPQFISIWLCRWWTTKLYFRNKEWCHRNIYKVWCRHIFSKLQKKQNITVTLGESGHHKQIHTHTHTHIILCSGGRRTFPRVVALSSNLTLFLSQRTSTMTEADSVSGEGEWTFNSDQTFKAEPTGVQS